MEEEVREDRREAENSNLEDEEVFEEDASEGETKKTIDRVEKDKEQRVRKIEEEEERLDVVYCTVMNIKYGEVKSLHRAEIQNLRYLYDWKYGARWNQIEKNLIPRYEKRERK